MTTPAARFHRQQNAPVTALHAGSDTTSPPTPQRTDGTWVARRASAVGVVCVNWQQVCLGVAAARRNIDVWVTDQVMQFYDGEHLLRTEARASSGEVRKKRASVPTGRRNLKTSVTELPN